ncbi:hypothetical protein [Nocardia grenadensis]|uniref:hypothetical protein n=1 Tax=Nocardia grenadensis TaxID=931537 RepID=UPI003D932AB6
MVDGTSLKAVIPTGTYQCVWFLGPGSDSVAGEIELQDDRSPHGSAQWTLLEPERIVNASGRYELAESFPQDGRRNIVRGIIDELGLEIALVNVSIHTWYRGKTWLDAEAAIVGHKLPTGEVPGFSNLQLQLTGIDAVGGASPIAHIIGGSPDNPRGWDIRGNPDATQIWSNDEASVTLTYQTSSNAIDPFRIDVSYLPMIAIELCQPISLRDWVDDWCEPLRRIVGAVLDSPSEISSMSFRLPDGTAATVFGSSVSSQPYVSDIEKIRKSEPVFTTLRDGVSLLDLVVNWRVGKDLGNPLVEGFNPYVLTNRQHPRFRLLLLIQLLEALDGFENRATNAERASRYTDSRLDIIESIKALRESGAISSANFRFIKENLSKRPINSLDAALKRQFSLVGSSQIDDRLLAIGSVSELASELNPPTSVNALRVIRNDLSHGNRDYPSGDLHRIALVVKLVTRIRFMQLLGCGVDVAARMI